MTHACATLLHSCGTSMKFTTCNAACSCWACIVVTECGAMHARYGLTCTGLPLVVITRTTSYNKMACTRLNCCVYALWLPLEFAMSLPTCNNINIIRTLPAAARVSGVDRTFHSYPREPSSNPPGNQGLFLGFLGTFGSCGRS